MPPLCPNHTRWLGFRTRTCAQRTCADLLAVRLGVRTQSVRRQAELVKSVDLVRGQPVTAAVQRRCTGSEAVFRW